MTVYYGTQKRTLDYFEGKIKDEILKEPGVGLKTYAKIQRALFWRSLRLVLVSPFRRVSPRRRTRKKMTPARIIGRLFIALLVTALLLLALAGFLSLTYNPASDSPAVQPQSVASPTPTQVVVEVVATDESTGVPVVQEGLVYLRVETQRLDTKYGIWRRMPGIPVFLSPFVDGDAAPLLDPALASHQVTEELLTSDGFLVAVTTFETQPGTYWVWVDEPGLPAGCAVWVPRFSEDADSGITVDEPVVVTLDAYEGFNTFVVKFQIICGIELGPTPTVVNTSPPGQTPVVPPTDPPPTDPPPTDPPPTDPPPSPTEVICTGCQEPPKTPVPTPVPIEVTATPTR